MTLREWIIAVAKTRSHWDAGACFIDRVAGIEARYIQVANGHGDASIVISTDVFSSKVVYDAV